MGHQLPEISKDSIINDKHDFDERTHLERAAISSIIPDPEQFSVSDQNGKFFEKFEILTKNLDEMLKRNSMHMVLCEPNFGKRTLQPEFITIPPPLYKGPDDEVEIQPKIFQK